jgi:hypothetical protein
VAAFLMFFLGFLFAYGIGVLILVYFFMPVVGFGLVLYACGVGLSLICNWSISVAPVRGRHLLLCRRKESKQRKRLHTANS